MSVVLITGSGGLVGSEAAIHFGNQGRQVVGIDNDMRGALFGADASTEWNTAELHRRLSGTYVHVEVDIRSRAEVFRVFRRYGGGIDLVIHAAAQPSHDWAARDPFTDFDINAVGTINLLEATRRCCPEAPFVFLSTNKVYGDRPNSLPLVELETRFEIAEGHPFGDGITEDMSLDRSLHSLFGASKLAADVMVQEYGRYFGIPTACLRGGTLTGPRHSATELHGFLAYVMRCAMTATPYTVFGYGGKQVRDALHSKDLIRAIEEFATAPRIAEVYNIGGGRSSSASVLEAIAHSEQIVGEHLEWNYRDRHRVGDHRWWIGSNSKFMSHYPGWGLEYDVEGILREIFEANAERWRPRSPQRGAERVEGASPPG